MIRLNLEADGVGEGEVVVVVPQVCSVPTLGCRSSGFAAAAFPAGSPTASRCHRSAGPLLPIVRLVGERCDVAESSFRMSIVEPTLQSMTLSGCAVVPAVDGIRRLT